MCTFLTEAIFLYSKTCSEEETAARQWYHVNKDRWIELLVLLQRFCKHLLCLRRSNLLLKFVWFRKLFANAASGIKYAAKSRLFTSGRAILS